MFSSLLNKFTRGLQKTKTTLIQGIQRLFTDTKPWDDETYEQLEETLLATDLGFEVTSQLIENIRDRYEHGEIKTASDIYQIVSHDIQAILDQSPKNPAKTPVNGPLVILIVGVNGSGKTTSIAKLAYKYQKEGKSVLLGACDTFRAAGSVQLERWAEQLGVDVVAGQTGSDAAAVAYDTIKAGLQRKADIIIVDTAGRQHTRKELMDELEKMKRTITKAFPEAPHEVWMTVDGSTGTNALRQANEFGKLCNITGLILTKVDGSGKGGVTVAIAKELGYPVKFIGLGEAKDDLQPFDAQTFVEALFATE